MNTRSVVLLGLSVGALLLAGCAESRTKTQLSTAPGELDVVAKWAPWEGSDAPHLIITLRHAHGGPVDIGSSGVNLTVTGPQGPVPIDWSSQSGAREIRAGESVEVALHPTLLPDGSVELSIDHATGTHVSLPAGTYYVCADDRCGIARLA